MSLRLLGLTDVPFNPSGVPSLRKRYSPIGFEKEIRELIEVYEYFKRINDSILVAVVGEYGWGKSELLDLFEEHLSNDGGCHVVRIPLAVGLKFEHVVKLIKSRSDGAKPLVLLIDEADEISRVVAIDEMLRSSEFKSLVINLGTLIRALLEPRQYSSILNIDVMHVNKILIVIAVTPQIYFNILKNVIPDVFDVSRGRVFKEILIDSRTPLWKFEAIVKSRLEAYSTDERISKVRERLIDELHPLRFEYLSTLYYMIKLRESTVTPRTLIKHLARLFSLVLRDCTLNYKNFHEFMVNELGVKSIDSLCDLKDETLRNVCLAVALSAVPRTSDSIRQELGLDVEYYLDVLSKSNIVEMVKVVEVDPLDRREIDEVNRFRLSLNLAPVLYNDIHDLSIEYGNYFTRYNNGEVRLYVIFPADAEIPFKHYVAYQITAENFDRVFRAKEVESHVSVRQAILKCSHLLRKSGAELVNNIISAVLGKDVSCTRLGRGYVYLLENSLDVRLCLLAYYVNDADDMRLIKHDLLKIISDGFVRLDGATRYFDAIILVLLSHQCLTKDIESNVSDLLDRRWKIVQHKVRDFVKVIVFGSDKLGCLQNVLVGYELSKINDVPSEYDSLVKYYSDLRSEVDGFIEEVRRKILKLTIGIKRGRESKSSVIRKIVSSWIRGEALDDQPDVFKGADGKPKISDAELALHQYLVDKNIEQISSRELEELIERILPVHLWRELKPKDLIELCRLRGLIIPLDVRLTKYMPLSLNNLDLVKKSIRELIDVIERITTANVNVRIGDATVKLVLDLRSSMYKDIVKAKNLLDVLSPHEGFEKLLMRVSDIMLILDDLASRIARLSEISSKLSERISEKISLLERKSRSVSTKYGKLCKLSDEICAEISSAYMRACSDVMRHLESVKTISVDLVDTFLQTVDEIVSRFDEEIESFANMISDIANKWIEIVELSAELSTLGEILQSGHSSYNVLSISHGVQDMIALLRMRSKEVTRRYYDDVSSLLHKIRQEYSALLVQYNSVRSKYLKMRDWICGRAMNKVEMSRDLCRESLASEIQGLSKESIVRFKEIKNLIDSMLNDLSRRFNVGVNIIRRIAEHGYNVGIDVSSMSRDLGLDERTIIAILERLHSLGLVDRKFVS